MSIYSLMRSGLAASVVAYKLGRMAGSVHQIYSSYHNDKLTRWQKTHHIGINTLFLIAEGVSTFPCSDIRPQHLLGVQTMAIATNIGRTISKDTLDSKSKSTLKDYANLVSFEIIDLPDKIRLLKPAVLGDNVENCAVTVEYMAALALLYFNRDTVAEVPAKVVQLWRNSASLFNYLREKRISFTVRAGPDGQPIFPVSKEVYIELTTIQNLAIESMAEIPPAFEDSDVFKQYHCPISNKPIRFISIVKGTQNTGNPVFYERAKILDWIQNNPTERPEKWPDGIDYCQSNIVDALDHQALINRQLKIRQAVLQETRYEVAQDEVADPPAKRQKRE